MTESEPVRPVSARLVPRDFDPAGSVSSIPGSERPLAKLCDLFVTEALLNKAAQIRLAESDQGTVEYLVDGEWKLVMKIPIQAYRPLISWLKQLAGLETSDARRLSGQLHVMSEAIVRAYPLSIDALSSGSDLAIIRLDAAAT